MSDNSRARVFSYIKQDKTMLLDCDDASVFTGSTDVTSLTTTATHREGSSAVSFAKTGTTEAFASISRTFSAEQAKNLVDYINGKAKFWLQLPSLTNIASVDLFIGESASHNFRYNIPDTSLDTNLTQLTVNLDSPTAQTGNGAAWSSINFVQLKVNFDAIGNTLSGIIFDALSIESKVNVEATVDPTGLATAGNQDEQTALLTTISGAFSKDSSAALEKSSVSKASAGKFRGMAGRIDSTEASGTFYIQMLDAASLPGDGAVTHIAPPIKVIHVTGSDSYFDFNVLPGYLTAAVGIVWCVSSTEFTKTIVATDKVSAIVLFE